MMSVSRSPVRCTQTFDLGRDGPHRLYRTCLRTEGHKGDHDFGIPTNAIRLTGRKVPVPAARKRRTSEAVVIVLAAFALAAVILFILFVPRARAASIQAVDRAPRCAIQNISVPRILGSNPKGQRFIWAEFINKCLDPVMEMGSYACLEEISTPGGPPKVVDCHANIDRSPFTMLSPHETNVFMVAKCNYTTIARYYKVTGYAWAVSLPTDSVPPAMKYYKSPKKSSKTMSWSSSGPGDVHFCDISPAGTSWRNFR